MKFIKMRKLTTCAVGALMSSLVYCGPLAPAMADAPQTGPGFVVNVANDNDNGCTIDDCSLREAISAADSLGGGTITFNITTVGPHLISLNTALPDLTDGIDVVNTGTGINIVTVARSSGAATNFGIFNIAANATCTVSGLILRDGRNTDGGAVTTNTGANLTLTDCIVTNNQAFSSGGGIFSNGSTTTIRRCTFTSNTATRGGGVFHGNGTLLMEDSTISGNSGANAGGGGLQTSGEATLTNCTISGNDAGFNSGGGILNQAFLPLTLNHCTITLNNAYWGGGIATQSGASFTMNNTIVAGNTGTMGVDMSGEMTAGDYNLVQNPAEATLAGTHNVIGLNPQLGPLANNGGPTATHAPAASSPVINAGDPAFDGTGLFDQRGTGFERTSGSHTDIGAVELQGDPDAYPQAKDGSFDVPGGQSYSGTLYGTDADGDALTFDIATPPQHGNVTITNPATGAFTFVADDVRSPDSFVYSVTSGGKTVTATMSIRITEIPSLVVTSTGGAPDPYDNQATLHDAILYANSPQAGPNPVITFNLPGAGPHTIVLLQDLPPISGKISILNEGTGAERVTLDGNETIIFTPPIPTIIGPRLFLVEEGETLTLSGLTLTRSPSVLDNRGTTTIRGCTITNNASAGPVVENMGALTFVNTTFAQNFAFASSVVRVGFIGTMTYINCTLNDGSNIDNNLGFPGSLQLFNTIANNGSGGSGITGSFSGDHNLIGGDSGLSSAGLANNGGLVDTIALREDGPAIHAGDNSHVPAGVNTDARGTGFPRILGPSVDIGAFEARLYGISGYIRTSNLAPIPGVSVQLSNGSGNYGAPVTTDASGFYRIIGVEAGNFTVTPTLADWTFSPSSQNLTVTTADRGANFIGTRTAPTYSISGRVAGSDGAALPGVSVALTPTKGGVYNPVLTNSAGYYTFTNVPNDSYTVTPSKSGVTFSPVSRSVTVSGANQNGHNFIGISGHKIIGRVMTAGGIGVADVTVSRTGAGSTPVLTNSAGYYTFYNVPDGSVTVTPSKTGYIFTPTSKIVTMAGADVSGQNFIAATGYTITGRIATSGGAPVEGVDVQLDSGPTVPTNSAGYFTFHNVANGSHTLTPSKSGYSFTPVNRNVTVNNGNISGQNFVAIAP